jgi:Flp pilus assembly protein TadD
MPSTMLGLSSVYRKLGQDVEAEREMQEARRLSENENTYNRACIAALSGETDQALDLLKVQCD